MFVTKQNITILPHCFRTAATSGQIREKCQEIKKTVSCKWKGRQYLSNTKMYSTQRETEGEIMGTGDEEQKK